MEGLINKIQIVWRADPADLPDVLYPFKRSEMMLQKLYLKKGDLKIISKKKLLWQNPKYMLFPLIVLLCLDKLVFLQSKKMLWRNFTLQK